MLADSLNMKSQFFSPQEFGAQRLIFAKQSHTHTAEEKQNYGQVTCILVK